jgi:hypothetical protein
LTVEVTIIAPTGRRPIGFQVRTLPVQSAGKLPKTAFGPKEKKCAGPLPAADRMRKFRNAHFDSHELITPE